MSFSGPSIRVPSARDPGRRVESAGGSIVGEAIEHLAQLVGVGGVGPLAGQRRELVPVDVAMFDRRLPAGEGGVDHRLQALLLGGAGRLVAVGELGQHLAAEQLDRLHDVLVLVAARLEHEDHLVDARLLVAAEVLDGLLGRADAAPQPGGVAGRDLGAEALLLHGAGDGLRIEALRAAALLVLGPHVRDAGPVGAEHVEVAEAVAEEVGALGATADRLVLVVVEHHRRHARHLRVDGEADRHALLVERLLVLVHPRARLFGIDERERQRADALLGGEPDRLAPAARHPQRRVRFLDRLGHDVARRHLHELAVDAGERRLDHAADRGLEALEPGVALAQRIDLEAGELGLARRLAAAELDPAVGDEVEHRHPLGGARRVVELRGGEDDAVAETDLRRALAAGGEEHLRRRGVAVLLEEVVLDLPHVLDAEPVGELDLLERVLDQRLLAGVVPRPAHLVLVEDAELHAQDVNTLVSVLPHRVPDPTNPSVLSASDRPWRRLKQTVRGISAGSSGAGGGDGVDDAVDLGVGGDERRAERAACRCRSRG